MKPHRPQSDIRRPKSVQESRNLRGSCRTHESAGLDHSARRVDLQVQPEPRRFGNFADASANFSDIFAPTGPLNVFRGAPSATPDVPRRSAAHRDAQHPIPRLEECKTCKGRGAKPARPTHHLHLVPGQGTVRSSRFLLHPQLARLPWHRQDGASPCASCSGAGRIKRHKTLSVKILPCRTRSTVSGLRRRRSRSERRATGDCT